MSNSLTSTSGCDQSSRRGRLLSQAVEELARPITEQRNEIIAAIQRGLPQAGY